MGYYRWNLHKKGKRNFWNVMNKKKAIIVEIKGDDAENIQSYSNPDVPIAPKLTSAIAVFIKAL